MTSSWRKAELDRCRDLDGRVAAILERMADSQREQREIARRTGALENYDALIAAGPAGALTGHE